MAFSVLVEMLNLRIRRGTPVQLHEPHLGAAPEESKKPVSTGKHQ
jgi:hypothetical protein